MQIQRCGIDIQREPSEAIRVWMDFGNGFYKWGRRKFDTDQFMNSFDYAERLMNRWNRIFGKVKDVRP